MEDLIKYLNEEESPRLKAKLGIKEWMQSVNFYEGKYRTFRDLYENLLIKMHELVKEGDVEQLKVAIEDELGTCQVNCFYADNPKEEWRHYLREGKGELNE